MPIAKRRGQGTLFSTETLGPKNAPWKARAKTAKSKMEVRIATAVRMGESLKLPS